VPARFHITDVPGHPPAIRKAGDPGAIAREVAALELLADRDWTPALVGHGSGWMVSRRLPGEPRPVATATPSELRRLGALLRELHEVRRAAAGGLWWWPAPAGTLAGYRRARAEDAERMLAGGPDAGLARGAVAAAEAAGEDEGPDPFRLLHGDLVESNVVWGPAGPALVDWEFSRMGDPAEDLAYLAETNALGAPGLGALLDGYDLAGMAERLEGWRALVAADAGAWYLAEGLVDEGARMLARARSVPASGAARRPG